MIKRLLIALSLCVPTLVLASASTMLLKTPDGEFIQVYVDEDRVMEYTGRPLPNGSYSQYVRLGDVIIQDGHWKFKKD